MKFGIVGIDMWIEFVLRGCMYGLGKFKMQITVNLQKDFKKNNFLKFQRINAGVVFFFFAAVMWWVWQSRAYGASLCS